MYLHTYGSLFLSRDGRDDERVLQDVKPLVLLAYLALTPGRRMRRDHAAELLWGGNGEGLAGARRSLRQALYTLRRSAEQPLVDATDTHLELMGVAYCDGWELAEAVTLGDHARVVELTADSFLQNVARRLGGELQEWIEIQDGRRRVARREALCALIEQSVTEGRHEQAEAYARLWVEDEPLADEPRKVLIRILAGSGDQAGAHQVYEEYRAVLRSALDEEPSAEIADSVAGVRRVLLEDHDWRSLAELEDSVLTRRSAGRYAAAVFVAGLAVGGALVAGLAARGGRTSPVAGSEGPPYGGGELMMLTPEGLIGHRPADTIEGWERRRVTGWFTEDMGGSRRGPYRTEAGDVWTDRVTDGVNAPYATLLRPDSSALVILRAEGDVGRAVPSPDGRWFLMSRQRPDANEFAEDLVIVARESLREAGPSPAHHVLYSGPSQVPVYTWSPDGLAIATVAQDSVDRLIVMRPDGTIQAEFSAKSMLAVCWLGGSNRIATLARSSAGTRVLVHSVVDGTTEVLASALGESLACAPNGGAVAHAGVEDLTPVLLLTDVASGESMRAPIEGFLPTSLIWWAPDAPSEVPGRLTITGLDGPLRWGVGHSLQALVEGESGSSWSDDIRWQSLDPWIASISDQGYLFANHVGTTAIIASLHGWVADTLLVTVTGEAPLDLVLQDDLGSIDPAEWRVVSEPPPVPVLYEDEPVLWLAGDGRYSDGLMSVRPFTLAGGGLAELEFFFDAPRPAGDRISLCLMNLPDSNLDRGAIDSERVCVRYPAGELRKFDPTTASLSSSSGGYEEFELPRADPSPWRRLSVIVRPDGQVSVRVNDRELAALPTRLRTVGEDTWHAHVAGASTDPRLLVRNFSLWQGASAAR